MIKIKKNIYFIFLIIFLSACNSYELSEKTNYTNNLENKNLYEIYKIDELINKLNNFTIEEINYTLRPALEIHQRNSGNVYEIFRLFIYKLNKNNYQTVMLVYETNDNEIDAVVVYRDLDKPKYLYYDNKFKNIVHGYSFEDLFDKEQIRINKTINRYGIFTENDLNKNNFVNIKNITEWFEINR